MHHEEISIPQTVKLISFVVLAFQIQTSADYVPQMTEFNSYGALQPVFCLPSCICSWMLSITEIPCTLRNNQLGYTDYHPKGQALFAH